MALTDSQVMNADSLDTLPGLVTSVQRICTSSSDRVLSLIWRCFLVLVGLLFAVASNADHVEFLEKVITLWFAR